jgi:predicted RNA-binding protein Jag
MQAPSKTYFAVLGNFDERNIPRGKIYSTSTLDVSTFFGQIANNQISADIQIDDLNEEEEEESMPKYESQFMGLLADATKAESEYKSTQMKTTTKVNQTPDAVPSDNKQLVDESSVNKQPEAKQEQPQDADQNKLLESIQKMDINTTKKVEDANNLINELIKKDYSEPVIGEYRTAFESMLKKIGQSKDTYEKNTFLNNNKEFFKTLCGHIDNTDENKPIYLCINLGISASINENFNGALPQGYLIYIESLTQT